MRAIKGSAGPVCLQVPDGDEWISMLQKSVSPQKRDRVFLKGLKESAKPPGEQTGGMQPKNRSVSDGRGFATSIDLMNSLFEKAKATPVAAVASAARSQGFAKVGFCA
jgi:nuclear pore complex protein Nup98-Nup96